MSGIMDTEAGKVLLSVVPCEAVPPKDSVIVTNSDSVTRLDMVASETVIVSVMKSDAVLVAVRSIVEVSVNPSVVVMVNERVGAKLAVSVN